MRKIINILLTTAIIACTLSVNIFAEGECHCGETDCNCGNSTPVTNISQMSTSGNYYLDTDIEIGSNPWNIPSDVDIHLCLNGHNIKTASGTYIGDYMINVYGNLTICDCKEPCGCVEAIHANGLFNVSGSGAILNIENGNFIARRHGRNLVNVVSGAKASISGGTFSNEENNDKELSVIYGILVSTGEGSLINISGGKFIAKKTTNKGVDFIPFLFNTDGKGKFSITDGYFDAVYYGYSTYSLDTATITGGTFASASGPAIAGGIDVDIAKKLPADYELTAESTSGPYKVEKIKAYKIKSNYYSNLNEAINAAENGDTIVVLKDRDLASTKNIDKDITIDLNGHTLKQTGADKQAFNIVENGKLTLNDLSSSGRLYAYNKCPTLIRVNGGELVVNGGNYDIQVNNYFSYSHVINCFAGKVTLNGGNFAVLKGLDTQGDNLYSSVVAATKSDSGKESIINIVGGTYNCSYSESESGKFASRIFTPYKDSNSGFGTINVSGGNFNGDYNNPELTEIKNYLNITGGSFDRKAFSNNLELKDMIDENNYKVVTTSDSPARYNVVYSPKKSKDKGYNLVNTGVK